MKRIAYKQNGITHIVSPAQDDDAFVAFVIDKDVRPNAAEWFIVEHDEIPFDRYFRDAWDLVDGKVVVDVDKAKSIKLDRIRIDRNKALDASDKEVAKLMDQGSDLTAIRGRRQALRDIPQTINLDGLSAEELKNLDPIKDI